MNYEPLFGVASPLRHKPMIGVACNYVVSNREAPASHNRRQSLTLQTA
ncbi:MAG: hypothetical protein LUF85_10095 [Bacteroides sp.]|nr:hypothetical protein [Bacteroides sp.]